MLNMEFPFQARSAPAGSDDAMFKEYSPRTFWPKIFAAEKRAIKGWDRVFFRCWHRTAAAKIKYPKKKGRKKKGRTWRRCS